MRKRAGNGWSRSRVRSSALPRKTRRRFSTAIRPTSPQPSRGKSMSRRRRRRTSPPCSPPSSPTGVRAASAAPARPDALNGANGHAPSARLVRPAESEQDAVAIFRFLCRVARPVLHCPIAGEKAFGEIARVVGERDHGFAYMAFENGALVGTLGGIFGSWWDGDDQFVSGRWFFPLPGHRWAGARLLAEADAIARAVGVPLIVNLKQRRTTAAVTFVKPALLGADHRPLSLS